jgi:hypothetical protein
MFMIPSKPNILFLKNVFPERLETIEQEYDNRIYEEAGLLGYNDELPIAYDKIPAVFVDVESWPKSTNILCWCCSMEFGGRPYFIPERIKSHKDGGTEMITHGVFCTANCAIRYLNTEYSDKSNSAGSKLSNWDAYHGVKIVHRLFTGRSVEKIDPSPPKTIMRQYGGDLTESQYREMLGTFSNSYSLGNFEIDHYCPR